MTALQIVRILEAQGINHDSMWVAVRLITPDMLWMVQILSSCGFRDSDIEMMLMQSITPDLWPYLKEHQLAELGIEPIGRRLRLLRWVRDNMPVPAAQLLQPQPPSPPAEVLPAPADPEESSASYAEVAAVTAPAPALLACPAAPIRSLMVPKTEYQLLGVEDCFNRVLDPVVSILERSGGILKLRDIDRQFTDETGFDIANQPFPYSKVDIYRDPRLHLDKENRVLLTKSVQRGSRAYEQIVDFYIGGLIHAGVSSYLVKYVYYLVGRCRKFVKPTGSEEKLVAPVAADDKAERHRKCAVAKLIALNAGDTPNARRKIARVIQVLK